MSPQTITLENGDTMEVPTEEELNQQKEALENAEKLKADVDDLSSKLKTYEEDPANKNFKALREKTARLEEALKATGQTLDDEGNIVEKPTNLTAEQITDISTKAATTATLNQHKTVLLSKYSNDEDKKKVVEYYYNKLSAGEELDIQKVTQIFTEAERLASPGENISNNTIIPGGAPPRSNVREDGKTSFADTDAGKSIANEIFGANSYANETKK